MAIGITVKNNQTIESAESVAVSAIEWASDTGGTILNAAATERFIEVNIQVSVTFNASATGDAKIHIRKSSDNGTTEDTEGNSTVILTIPVSAGNTVTRSFSVYDFDYLDVGCENEDGSYTLTWSAKWDGKYFTGLASS